MICHGSCVEIDGNCYYNSLTLDYLKPCSIKTQINVLHPDTSDFEIIYLIDTFLNSIAFDWDVFGADSFDIYIDDVFETTQSFSSLLLPITADLKDTFTLRVVPRSVLGCSFNQSDIQYKSDGTSVGVHDQKALENSLFISPNPSQGVFKISSKSNILKTAVFDLNGRKMMSSKTEKIDLSSFENGIYLFKIRTEFGVVLKRVLKI